LRVSGLAIRASLLACAASLLRADEPNDEVARTRERVAAHRVLTFALEQRLGYDAHSGPLPERDTVVVGAINGFLPRSLLNLRQLRRYSRLAAPEGMSIASPETNTIGRLARRWISLATVVLPVEEAPERTTDSAFDQ
jgi:hypothetical protein